MGISYETFLHLTPKRLNYFIEGYKIKQKMRDEEMWLLGQYFMSALDATVCNHALWRGKHGKPSKYIEKPILQTEETKEKVLTEEEKKKQLEKFVLSMKLMEKNYKAEHGIKDGSVS